jgi:hypothetical protein
MLAGYATSVIATVLTLILGSIIIALAWLGARPMLSLAVIAIGGADFVLGKFGKREALKEVKVQSDTSANIDADMPIPPPREAHGREEPKDAEVTKEAVVPTPPPRRK